MEVSGQLHTPSALSPGEEPTVPTADLGAVVKRKSWETFFNMANI